MAKISKFGEAFLLLALRIGKHINGYVDFYIGPAKFENLVNNESISSPNELLNNCMILQKSLFVQGYDKDRERYLESHLLAMQTSIEDLLEVEIPFKEKFLRIFDVDLQPIKESKLENLMNDFNEAYKGMGSLEERMKILRERRKVPEDKIYSLFEEALNITRKKTKEIFGNILPKDERIILELINDNNDKQAKWAYYEWYLGNFQSQIEINPKYDLYWTTFLSAAAHEGYPGHHTNFAINEEYLFKELNQSEHSILLLKSPKLVICEGIADIALDMLFSYREQAELSLQFSVNVIKEDTVENLARQNRVKAEQSLFWYNLAYHALFDKWSEEKLFKYAASFKFLGEKNLKNTIKLIFDPVYSTNFFSYNLGRKLIINKYGEYPSTKNFQNLLSNPVIPSDLV